MLGFFLTQKTYMYNSETENSNPLFFIKTAKSIAVAISGRLANFNS